MPVSRSAVALACAAVAAVPATASAAPWSSPTTVPGSEAQGDGPGPPSIALGPSGGGLISWSQQSSSLPSPLLGAEVAPGGAVGATRMLAPALLNGVPRAEGGATVVGADLPAGGSTPALTVPIVAAAPAGAPLGPLDRLLDPGQRGRLIDLAVNRRGDAVAAVTIVVRGKRSSPALVYRRAGRSFGRPVVLGDAANINGMSVSIDARGRALVAWERPLVGKLVGKRVVLARLRGAGGRLGPARRLGTATPSVTVTTALEDDGQAIVGWLGHEVSEGSARGAATLRAAVARRGDDFGRAWTLEKVDIRGTGRYLQAPGIKALAAPSGRSELVWTGRTDGRYVVRAANVANGRIGAPRPALDTGTNVTLADAEIAADGRVVVVGSQGIAGADPAGPVSLVAAVAHEVAFGPVETVRAQAPGALHTDVDIAIDPATGRTVAVWREVGLPAAIATATREA